MGCSSADRELITFWLAGTLEPEERQRVSRHVAQCEACRTDAAAGAALFAELRQLHLRSDEIVAAAAGDLDSPHLLECSRCGDEVAALRAINLDLARAPALPPMTWRWLLGLSAAATVVLGVSLFRIGGPEAGRRPEPGIVVAPPRQTPAADAVRTPIPVEKASLTALAIETVRLRGAGDPRAAFLDDLAVALEPYRRDDLATAANRLRGLQPRYPDAPEIPYYLGVCLVVLNRPAEAIAPLKRARSAMSPPDEAAYYLAVARINAGEAAPGLAELHRLCAGRSEVRSRACAAASLAAAPRSR